jgi:ATP:ADP antiporter, AAA family
MHPQRPFWAPVPRLATRVLGIRAGELERGVLLFSYLFLVIGSFVAGKATRDALFLFRFSARQLPYVDIAVAVLVGVWVAIYIRVGQRVSVRTLICGSLVFFAANSLLFWYLSHFREAPWVLPVVYVWVGMFGVIAAAQVWTLANYVLTTREAKRLFGFIGSGAISGNIVGGFVVQQTATRFGAESTLIGMAVALLICAVLVDRLWRLRHLASAGESDDEGALEGADRGPTGLRESVHQIAASPYLRAIAALILASSFVTAVAAWQFKAIAVAAIREKDSLTAFFGSFTFYTGLLSLLLQWLVTSRLLRRFGLGVALSVVPVALALGSVGLLISGSLAAAILLRGSDQVLRYSIDRPAAELLYLPLPAEQTLQVKSFIDTVVWRLGDGLSGLVILLLATGLHWPVAQIGWVNLLLLAGWLAAAWVAQRQYVTNLGQSIKEHRQHVQRANVTVLDKAATEILTTQMGSDDPERILYALELFTAGHSGASHPVVRGLLKHPSAQVRARAVAVLNEADDLSVRGDVERLLYDPDLSVRTEALLYIAHHAHIDPLERVEQLGNFPDFSIRSAMVSFLAQPGETQNLDAAQLMFTSMVRDEERRTRLEAARLLERLPDVFDAQLAELLGSDDPDVLRHAMHAAGRSRKRRFIDTLIRRLADDRVAEDATEALAQYDDRVIGTLRDHLMDQSTAPAIRREIPGVLLRIGSAAAEGVLTETLLDGDTVLRFRVLTALNKLRAAGSSRPLDVKLVETVLAAEVVGHLRSYQILATLDYAADSREPVAQALRESMMQEVERIFRLVKLLSPVYDLESAYVGLQSSKRDIHDNALEFLENILKPQLRSLLLPLLDSDVSVQQRVALANRTLGTTVASREEAAALLAESGDPWLQACAAYAIGELRLAGLAHQVDTWCTAADPLLRATAAAAQAKLKDRAAMPPVDVG